MPSRQEAIAPPAGARRAGPMSCAAPAPRPPGPSRRVAIARRHCVASRPAVRRSARVRRLARARRSARAQRSATPLSAQAPPRAAHSAAACGATPCAPMRPQPARSRVDGGASSSYLDETCPDNKRAAGGFLARGGRRRQTLISPVAACRVPREEGGPDPFANVASSPQADPLVVRVRRQGGCGHRAVGLARASLGPPRRLLGRNLRGSRNSRDARCEPRGGRLQDHRHGRRPGRWPGRARATGERDDRVRGDRVRRARDPARAVARRRRQTGRSHHASGNRDSWRPSCRRRACPRRERSPRMRRRGGGWARGVPRRAAAGLRADLRTDVERAGELARSALLAYVGGSPDEAIPRRLAALTRASSARPVALGDAAREPSERGERGQLLQRQVAAVDSLVDHVRSLVGTAGDGADDTAPSLIGSELQDAANSLADAADAVAARSTDGGLERSLARADGALSAVDAAFARARARRATAEFSTDELTRLLSVIQCLHAASSALSDLAPER